MLSMGCPGSQLARETNSENKARNPMPEMAVIETREIRPSSSLAPGNVFSISLAQEMKPARYFLSIVATAALICGTAMASEDTVTYAVQALTGLVGDTPRFEKVYCHDIHAFSGEPTSMAFICSPHFPPTNSQEKMEDHNLLSASGIKISGKLAAAGVLITLDASNLSVPKRLYGGSEESLIVFALECIRMTANLNRIENYSVEVVTAAELNDRQDTLKQCTQTYFNQRLNE